MVQNQHKETAPLYKQTTLLVTKVGQRARIHSLLMTSSFFLKAPLLNNPQKNSPFSIWVSEDPLKLGSNGQASKAWYNSQPHGNKQITHSLPISQCWLPTGHHSPHWFQGLSFGYVRDFTTIVSGLAGWLRKVNLVNSSSLISGTVLPMLLVKEAPYQDRQSISVLVWSHVAQLSTLLHHRQNWSGKPGSTRLT